MISDQTEPVTSMSQAERSSSTPTDGQEVRSPSSEILENGLNQSNSTDGHVNRYEFNTNIIIIIIIIMK